MHPKYGWNGTVSRVFPLIALIALGASFHSTPGSAHPPHPILFSHFPASANLRGDVCTRSLALLNLRVLEPQWTVFHFSTIFPLWRLLRKFCQILGQTPERDEAAPRPSLFRGVCQLRLESLGKCQLPFLWSGLWSSVEQGKWCEKNQATAQHLAIAASKH